MTFFFLYSFFECFWLSPFTCGCRHKINVWSGGGQGGVGMRGSPVDMQDCIFFSVWLGHACCPFPSILHICIIVLIKFYTHFQYLCECWHLYSPNDIIWSSKMQTFLGFERAHNPPPFTNVKKNLPFRIPIYTSYRCVSGSEFC